MNTILQNMTLENIAKACGGQLCCEPRQRTQEITGAVLDSRQVSEGMLFFATVGERVDGHRFIRDVFAKGALCVISQKTPEALQEEYGFAMEDLGAYILVEDSLRALKQIAAYYRSTLTIPIVGITGSVGKTSTKEYIAGVLSAKYRVLKTEGNFNNEIGVPLTLLRIRREHQAAVVEMGISDFGEMHRLSEMVRPNICVITNIGQCHLENLKTRDGILQAKSEMFDYMDPKGEVCLNGEDDKLAGLKSVKGRPVHFFGLGGNPAEEVYATDIVSRGLFGSEAVLHMPSEDGSLCDFKVQVTQPGIHMVQNSAAAACVGRLLGLTREEICAGIASVAPVSGRSHLIAADKYTLIDDCYNANPVSMKAAIDLLNMADTYKVAILGDMYELGENSAAMHGEVGAYAARAGIDRIICIGEHASELYRQALAQGGEAHYFAAKQEFLERGPQELLPRGCTVLIKASHGMGFVQLVEELQK